MELKFHPTNCLSFELQKWNNTRTNNHWNRTLLTHEKNRKRRLGISFALKISCRSVCVFFLRQIVLLNETVCSLFNYVTNDWILKITTEWTDLTNNSFRQNYISQNANTHAHMCVRLILNVEKYENNSIRIIIICNEKKKSDAIEKQSKAKHKIKSRKFRIWNKFIAAEMKSECFQTNSGPCFLFSLLCLFVCFFSWRFSIHFISMMISSAHTRAYTKTKKKDIRQIICLAKCCARRIHPHMIHGLINLKIARDYFATAVALILSQPNYSTSWEWLKTSHLIQTHERKKQEAKQIDFIELKWNFRFKKKTLLFPLPMPNILEHFVCRRIYT